MARGTWTQRGSLGRFRRWFWRPPRAHGEVERERRVSFLELFYDLVYVVVIAQAAHRLATDVSLSGVVSFAVVFGLIWTAWLNGSQYYEIHGREDGRTRAYVFVQMGILALLAVFTADAAGDDGTPFALVYAAYLLVLTWLWYTVRRADRPEFRTVTGQVVAGSVVSVVVIAASAFLPAPARLVVWAGFTISWVVAFLVLGRRSREVVELGVTATDSMVERFDLLTIIVLGEVVTGVVDGLATAAIDPVTIATGMVALVVGFGLWWIFFDFIGRRMPRNDGPVLVAWMMSHLPVTMAIAAAGAGMVSLVEHAHEARTPDGTAWLLAGAVAVALVSMAATAWTLLDHERLASTFRPLTLFLVGGALAAVGVAWWAPVPWVLAAALVAILTVVWAVAVERWLRSGVLDEPEMG